MISRGRVPVFSLLELNSALLEFFVLDGLGALRPCLPLSVVTVIYAPGLQWLRLLDFSWNHLICFRFFESHPLLVAAAALPLAVAEIVSAPVSQYRALFLG